MRPQTQQQIPLDTNTDFLRRHARGMLRSAHSDQPSKALSIVRRVHTARAFSMPRLTELYHARANYNSSICFARWQRNSAMRVGMPASATSIVARARFWIGSGSTLARLATMNMSGLQTRPPLLRGSASTAAGWLCMEVRLS